MTKTTEEILKEFEDMKKATEELQNTSNEITKLITEMTGFVDDSLETWNRIYVYLAEGQNNESKN